MSLCTVTIAVVSSTGAALPNSVVRTRVYPQPSTPPTYSTDSFVAVTASTAFTDTNGLVTVSLPQGARFRVEIPAVGMDSVGTVPASATVNLRDISLSPTGVVEAFDV